VEPNVVIALMQGALAANIGAAYGMMIELGDDVDSEDDIARMIEVAGLHIRKGIPAGHEWAKEGDDLPGIKLDLTGLAPETKVAVKAALDKLVEDLKKGEAEAQA
jgi:hypothetical protein